MIIYFRQGTLGVEFHQQVDDLDAIFVAVGGGGMSTGVAIATHHIRPKCKGERNARWCSLENKQIRMKLLLMVDF